MRHTHPVHFKIDEVGQPAVDLEVLELAEWVAPAAGRAKIFMPLSRDVITGASGQLWREQRVGGITIDALPQRIARDRIDLAAPKDPPPGQRDGQRQSG